MPSVLYETYAANYMYFFDHNIISFAVNIVIQFLLWDHLNCAYLLTTCSSTHTHQLLL